MEIEVKKKEKKSTWEVIKYEQLSSIGKQKNEGP